MHLKPFVEEQRRAAARGRLRLGVRRGRFPRRHPCSTSACAASATWSSRWRPPPQDVHSGLGGSIFANAAWRLTWALSTLKGPDERIRIPGFYDSVRPPSARDRELMAALPEPAEEYNQRYGLEGFLHGLTGGVELRLAEVFEPTCTICGLTSGYQGPGSKTVLPARASAKVDFRLVPDQTPEEVLRNLRAHLDREGFRGCAASSSSAARPRPRTDPDDPFVKLVVDAAQEPYGQTMQIVPMIGGSGPNHVLSKRSTCRWSPPASVIPAAQAHAPNENMRLDLYLKAPSISPAS